MDLQIHPQPGDKYCYLNGTFIKVLAVGPGIVTYSQIHEHTVSLDIFKDLVKNAHKSSVLTRLIDK